MVRPQSLTLAVALTLALPLAAEAHIGYGGRNFGSFDAAGCIVTIANQTVSGNYGWADGLDADFGDSHRLRAFRFSLTTTTTVTFSVAANAGATATSVGGLLPGFSVYQGLAHLAPFGADHDGAGARRAVFANAGDLHHREPRPPWRRACGHAAPGFLKRIKKGRVGHARRFL